MRVGISGMGRIGRLAPRATADEVSRSFAAAASGPLAGILGIEACPLVSADHSRDTRSAIVGAPRPASDPRRGLSSSGTFDRQYPAS
jgi:glyceraldehyde-3-phosphate dehydrogenase/erythrose-4-phosphate dehydrogenase